MASLPLVLPGRAADASAPSQPDGHGSSSVVAHWGAFTGVSNDDKSLVPVGLTLPGPVAELGTSNSTQYALLTNGTLYAWGSGTDGQLGDGSNQNSFGQAVQVRFPAGVRIASIPTDVMPFNTGLAVDTKGHAWGWGLNRNGQLCLGNSHRYASPVELPFSQVTTLAGAGAHAQYDAAGELWACGDGRNGELGNGSDKSSTTPVRVRVLNGQDVTSLVAAYASSGALLSNGTYYDWGTDSRGQLGDGRTGQDSDLPVQVKLPGAVVRVAQGGSLAGNGQTLVALANGALYAWGDNKYGQLGNGGSGVAASPVSLTPPHGVTYTALATGGATSYAISTTGEVYAWGNGAVGQLGDGKDQTSRTPVRVIGGATQISATAGSVAVVVSSGGH